jgi:hypothetical protein
MLGIQYYTSNPATYVMKITNGTLRTQGKGLSFFYNAATTSITAIPVNVQEAPFIFTLQSGDYQEVRIQGQVSFQVQDPGKVAALLNFNLKADGDYVSEDPNSLADRVVRAVQTLVQSRVQSVSLREALGLNQPLVELLKMALPEQSALSSLGLGVVDISIANITPIPETGRALEAQARESILKEADDAIYARRRFAVEQERTIKDAELQTELEVQQKEQEIVESRLANERAILRGEVETAREKRQADIEAEKQREELVSLNVVNAKEEADAEAYGIAARMNAFKELPVENLKAMALAKMNPEQMMAMAFNSLANNAGKIGELTITPDLFGKLLKQ